MNRFCVFGVLLALMAPASHVARAQADLAPGENPIFRDVFTADPAPLVVGDTLFVYVGHDEASGDQMFNITEWLAYSTTDMKTWEAHGPIMKPTDFDWAVGEAWASQVVERDGKYYFATLKPNMTEIDGEIRTIELPNYTEGPWLHERDGTYYLTYACFAHQGQGRFELLVLVDPEKHTIPERSDVAVSLEELGFTGPVRVRDLWQREDLGTFSSTFSRSLPLHGAGLYRLSPAPP